MKRGAKLKNVIAAIIRESNMSPIGKLLLERCDENGFVNMIEHWTVFYRMGYHKSQVEAYASKIGIMTGYLPKALVKSSNAYEAKTIPMIPASQRTMLGIPSQRFG